MLMNSHEMNKKERQSMLIKWDDLQVRNIISCLTSTSKEKKILFHQ